MACDILFFHIYAASKRKTYLFNGLHLKGYSRWFCVFWLWSHALLLMWVRLRELYCCIFSGETVSHSDELKIWRKNPGVSKLRFHHIMSLLLLCLLSVVWCILKIMWKSTWLNKGNFTTHSFFFKQTVLDNYV